MPESGHSREFLLRCPFSGGGILHTHRASSSDADTYFDRADDPGTNARALKVVALDEDEYFEVVRESAKAGQMGGIIFDALLLACARKAEAETIYTWNVRHFRLIAPD